MKKNKNQMIVLCCLVAVVLGLGVFKVMGNKPDTAPPEKPAVAVEAGTQAKTQGSAQRKTQEAPVAVEGVGVRAVEVGQKPAAASRDPFTPQVIAESARGSSGSSGSRSLVAQASRLPLPMITPLPTQPINFGGLGPSPQQSAETDPVSALRLTGVVEGSCNIAIIRGEGGARYILREGQSIDGKFVVQSISRNGVRLRFGGKTYVLRLGSPPSRKSA